MKRSIVLLLLLFTSQVLAQTKESVNYLKLDERTYWKVNAPCCENIYIDGKQFMTMNANGLYISVAFVDRAGFNTALLYVGNNSESKINVIPSNARYEYWKKYADLLDKPPFFTATPIPPYEVAQKIQDRSKWANFFTILSASFATKTANSTTNGNLRITDNKGNTANGTYSSTTTTTVPDREAMRAAQRTVNERNAINADNASRFLADSLEANTLLPGESIFGAIYFKEKKYNSAVFTITINNVEYGFLYSLPNNK